MFNQLSGKNLSIWRFGFKSTLAFIIIFSIFVGLISGIYPSLILARFQTIPSLKGNMGKMGNTVFFRNRCWFCSL